jgi:Fur family peroxide stress response transcriptional regulator
MITHTKEQIIKLFRNAGYRLTRQRIAVIDQIAERSDHPSVRQLYDEILQQRLTMSLATIYNTLETLVELDLIREIDFEHGDNRYDTNLSPHINLICTICGSIIDYKIDMPVAPQEIEKSMGFATTEYRLEYRGICKRCSHNK